MSKATSLFETGNFKPEVSAQSSGRISCFYLMSGEFMLLAKVSLKRSEFSQAGMIRYDAGIFCLGHALELTYKMLLLKDGKVPPKSHDHAALFASMTPETRNGIDSRVREAGWDSCEDFHDFLANDISFVGRKYYEGGSLFDLWTHDRSGQGRDHMLWPQLVFLCERLHRYAASTVWIDPSLPDERGRQLHQGAFP